MEERVKRKKSKEKRLRKLRGIRDIRVIRVSEQWAVDKEQAQESSSSVKFK